MAAWTLSSSGASAASSRASVASAVFAAAALLAILHLSSPPTQKKSVRNASGPPPPSERKRRDLIPEAQTSYPQSRRIPYPKGGVGVRRRQGLDVLNEPVKSPGKARQGHPTPCHAILLTWHQTNPASGGLSSAAS